MGASGVAAALPGGDLAFELQLAIDAAVEALAAQDADLDLDHVEPAGVLWGEVELDAAQDPSRLRGRQGLVEGGGGMGREVVENDSDPLGLGIMDVDEVSHAGGEVRGGAPARDLDVSPGSVGIEEDEEIGGAVALVLAVVALEFARVGGDRGSHLADELGRALVEADDRVLRIGRLGLEIEHVLHAGDVLGVDLGDAPHVLAPGLEVVLGQTPAHGFAR